MGAKIKLVHLHTHQILAFSASNFGSFLGEKCTNALKLVEMKQQFLRRNWAQIDTAMTPPYKQDEFAGEKVERKNGLIFERSYVI